MKNNFGRFLFNKKKSYVIKVPKPNHLNFYESNDLIIGKVDNNFIAYERVCDHAGGTLTLDNSRESAVCPIHGWKLLLKEGRYDNNCKKLPLKVVESNEFLEVERFTYEFPEINAGELVDGKINIFFNAHASATIEIDNLKLTTDPWFIGSCFATGWWHSHPPSEEAIARLKESDYIFISHNHPDHLHIPTLLKFVPKDKPLIIPNFESRSVEFFLINNGYNNLIITDFLRELDLSTQKGKIRLIIVKSGDDRDDSSLLVSTKNNKIFFGVDTNMPNNWVLPKIDILFTAFAGGASGYPSRIENFSLAEKTEINKKNRYSILSNSVKKLVASTSPKFVVPYAGYFTESFRDNDVKNINYKNSPMDLISYVEEEFKGVKGVDPLSYPLMSLHCNEFIKKYGEEFPSYFIDKEYVENEIREFSGKNWKITDDFLKKIGKEFIESQFYDNLTIILLPSDSEIKDIISNSLIIDFSSVNRSFQILKFQGFDNNKIIEQINNPNGNNIELLRVRADSFFGSFSRGLPLEDLSIGFQVKMFRAPNIYNFNFWYYFSNKYFIKVLSDAFEDSDNF
jgi:CMP-N-acetylneuraminate monooxygenase